MSFFCKISKFNSPINGELLLKQYAWGEWFLKIPEGEYYSGSYLEKMWKTILKRYLGELKLLDSPIKSGNDPSSRTLRVHYGAGKAVKVLVLGCGAGCAIEVLKNLWPKVLIDALDYDPVIIEIGKEIYNFPDPSGSAEGGKNANINFIISGAAEFVQKCEKKYDLIIVDLFYKNKPPPLLKDRDFISGIYKILEKSGTAIVNFTTRLSGEDVDIPKAWSGAFSELKPLNYEGNRLFAVGTLSVVEKSNIPEDYYNIFQDDVWAETLKKQGFVVAGETRSFSCILRLPLGFCVVNAMHTDSEPNLNLIKSAGCRHGVIFWSPWEKKIAPRPWMRSLVPLHQKGNGFSLLAPNYQEKWSQMARRNLKKFQAFGVEIKLASEESFAGGIKYSTLRPSLRNAFPEMIKRMNKNSIEFFTAQIPAMNAGQKDGKILGGLAVVNYGPAPAHLRGSSYTNLQNSYESYENLGFSKLGRISAHFVAYLTKDGQKYQAGVGLIDWWYKYALEKNIKYLNFGHIRQRGEPHSWQGYSDFKRKFIDKEIRLANGFWRLF